MGVTFKKKRRKRDGASFSLAEEERFGRGNEQEVEEDGADCSGFVRVVGVPGTTRSNAVTSSSSPASSHAEKRRKTSAIGHEFESSKSAAPAEYGGGAFAMDRERDEETRKAKELGPNEKRKKKAFGPMKATAAIRTTTLFDFQPDICKDYKETGFCGFGENCIYLHDRGDYKAGWQMEKEWEIGESKRQVKLANAGNSENGQSKENQSTELPFACHICRKPFTDPVKTVCNHYFCQKCALEHHRKTQRCAVCAKRTKGIFNAAPEVETKFETQDPNVEERHFQHGA